MSGRVVRATFRSAEVAGACTLEQVLAARRGASGEVHELELLVVSSVAGRLVGLLGTRPTDARARPLLLTPCPSVHTLGMAYPLDVALLDRDGSVVGSWRGLGPGRVVRVPGACSAIERPASDGPWPAIGERIVLWG